MPRAEEPDYNELCANCGRRYGNHYGIAPFLTCTMQRSGVNWDTGEGITGSLWLHRSGSDCHVQAPRAFGGWLCELGQGHTGAHAAFIGSDRGRPAVGWPNESEAPIVPIEYSVTGTDNRPYFRLSDPFTNPEVRRCPWRSRTYYVGGLPFGDGPSCDLVRDHEGSHVINAGPYSFGPPTEVLVPSQVVPNPNELGWYVALGDDRYEAVYCRSCVRAEAEEQGAIDPLTLEINAEWRGNPEVDVRFAIDSGHNDWCNEDEGENYLDCERCSNTITTCWHEELCDCGDGCVRDECESCDDGYGEDDYEDNDYNRACDCGACDAMDGWKPGDDELYVSELVKES